MARANVGNGKRLLHADEPNERAWLTPRENDTITGNGEKSLYTVFYEECRSYTI